MRKKIVVFAALLLLLTATAMAAPGPRGAAELGPYRFELDDKNELWLMDRTGKGVALPAVKAGSQYLVLADVAAYDGPNGTVIIEVRDQWDTEGDYKLVFSYSRSSLDWCMEHLAKPRPLAEDVVVRGKTYTSGNGVIIGRACVGTMGTEYWTSTDGMAWTPILDAPWTGERHGTTLLPFNGRTFVIQDRKSGALYASEDGRSWKEIGSEILESQYPENTAYGFCWTGEGYIAFQNVTGPDGGYVGAHDNQVLFLDQEFQPTGMYHDFGKRVSGVSYSDGICWARVAEDEALPHVIYASRDKAAWKENGAIYDLPVQAPAAARVAGDGSTYTVADPYFFKQEWEGTLSVSKDGVHFGDLGPLPYPEGYEDYHNDHVEAYVGADGVLVRMIHVNNDYINWTIEESYQGVKKTYTRAQVEAAVATAPQGEESYELCAPEGKNQVREVKASWNVPGIGWGGEDFHEYSSDGGNTWHRVVGVMRTYQVGSSALLPYNGKTFMISHGWGMPYLMSEDGVYWEPIPMDWAGAPRGYGAFLWTGKEYMVRQDTYSGGMAGMQATDSEKNNAIQFLDEDFHVTGSHDFGEFVQNMAYQNGTYYVQVGMDTLSVWTSTDRTHWTKTAMTQIPAS